MAFFLLWLLFLWKTTLSLPKKVAHVSWGYLVLLSMIKHSTCSARRMFFFFFFFLFFFFFFFFECFFWVFCMRNSLQKKKNTPDAMQNYKLHHHLRFLTRVVLRKAQITSKAPFLILTEGIRTPNWPAGSLRVFNLLNLSWFGYYMYCMCVPLLKFHWKIKRTKNKFKKKNRFLY